MTGRLKALYTVQELADMAGVSRNRMVRLLDAYGIEFMASGTHTKLVPLSQIHEKMKALYDSFKARDMYEEIVGELDE